MALQSTWTSRVERDRSAPAFAGVMATPQAMRAESASCGNINDNATTPLHDMTRAQYIHACLLTVDLGAPPKHLERCTATGLGGDDVDRYYRLGRIWDSSHTNARCRAPEV